ncbi:MAG: TRAP transporter substrate-binding protein DctP, partial [Natronospirillum sp.]
MQNQKLDRKMKLGLSGLALAGALMLPGMAASQSNVTIRIASVNDPTSESIKVVESVSERITERTDGRVQFQLFPSAQLGSTSDSLEQASQGQPVITFTSASFMATFGVPELSVVEGPFVIDDLEQGERLAFSDLLRGYYDELAEEANLRPLALNWFDGPRHMVGTSAYTDPSDLSGVKMRVPPVETWLQTFKPLGVVATTVEAAESYSALAQGVVDAAESPLTGLRANRWYEVAPHITETGHFNLFTGWVTSESVFQN